MAEENVGATTATGLQAGAGVETTSPGLLGAEARALQGRLSSTFADIFVEAFATILTIAVITLAHWLFTLSLGPDAKFFDLIPIRYVFDVADLALVVKLTWRVLRRFNHD